MIVATLELITTRIARLAWSLAVLLATVHTVMAAPYPDFSGTVVDEAQLLSRSTRAFLASELGTHRDQYGDEVVLATVQSLDGVNIAQYSLGLARHWRLGQSGADNGVLILFAPQERQMRIEVGYGLEHTLTDRRARDIINQHMRPHFQSGDFDAGAEAGVREVLEILRNPGAAGGDNTAKNKLKMAIPMVFAALFAAAHFFRDRIGKFALNLIVMSGVIGMVANVISERWYVGVAVALIAALVLHKQGYGHGTGSRSAIDGALPPQHYANPEDPEPYRDTPANQPTRGSRRGSRSGEGSGGGGFGGGGASGGW